MTYMASLRRTGTLFGAIISCFTLAVSVEASPRVLVAWDPNPEPDIGGYKVHYGTSPRVYDVILDVGNVTNAIVDNLTPGETYYFAATAYNTSSLESDYSEEVFITIPVDNSSPDLIIPLTITAAKQTATPVEGIQISDPDGDTELMQLDLSVDRGTISFTEAVPGGIAPNQIVGNGTKNVRVNAPLAAINTTLNAVNTLVYLGDRNLVGPDTFRATVTDNGNGGLATPLSKSKSAAVTVVGDTQDTWRNLYFDESDLVDPTKELTVYGDLADPDSDNLNNLLEYALGLSPEDREPLETAVNMILTTGGDGKKYAAIRFLRRKNETLVQYVPEVSSDKTAWVSGSANLAQVAVEDLDAEFEVATFQDLTPIDPTQSRFLRLRVVKNIQ